MTFWLLLLLLPSSTDSPRNQKNRWFCLTGFSRAKNSYRETLEQDGAVLDPIQLCPKLLMWAPANQLTSWGLKYAQSSLHFLMLWLCWLSGLGLPSAACSGSTVNVINIKLRAQVKKSQLRSPGTWKRIPAFLLLVLLSKGHTLIHSHFSETPRSTQRVVTSKWH